MKSTQIDGIRTALAMTVLILYSGMIARMVMRMHERRGREPWWLLELTDRYWIFLLLCPLMWFAFVVLARVDLLRSGRMAPALRAVGVAALCALSYLALCLFYAAFTSGKI